MKFSRKVAALIGARGGSKGVPKKNIRELMGFPLIAYAIAAAKLAKKVDRVIVSTDSDEIAEVSGKYGAEVPFLRPKEYASDKSPDREFILHAMEWLDKNEGAVPEFFVHLRPTTPLRDPKYIDQAIEKMRRSKEATSLRSGYEIRESPHKLFAIEKDFFVGLFPDDPRPEYYNLPRQSFPPVYQPDGYVDVISCKHAAKSPSLHGPKILSLITPNVGEIDSEEDFKFIEYSLKKEPYAIYEYLKKNFKK